MGSYNNNIKVLGSVIILHLHISPFQPGKASQLQRHGADE